MCLARNYELNRLSSCVVDSNEIIPFAGDMQFTKVADKDLWLVFELL